MKLLIINETKVRIPKTYWDQKLEKACRLLMKKGYSQLKGKELTLVFLNPIAAKKINQQFRQKSYATDVLSFTSADPKVLGELILCPQVLKKQAIEHELSFRDEGLYMLIHGILHLLGLDHEKSESEAKKMFSLQDSIFESLLSS